VRQEASVNAIAEATAQYEAWMRRHIAVVEGDLRAKHRAMAAAPFPFLRATFYRWVPLWREACPELAETPRLMAVGDLHAENFGTWRDAEGRLCWGVNDFDEAFVMPYAIDLVRLATSLLLAIRAQGLRLAAGEACAALLEGYAATMAAGEGRGFVLEEEHPALRAMAMSAERDPDRFWAKLAKGKPTTPPHRVGKLLRQALPEIARKPRILRRVAGLGSLGRPRYVAIGLSRGGLVAREAKAVLPSAYGFALGRDEVECFTGALAKRAIRSPDPFYQLRKGWLLRRLAPHCTKIEFGDLPRRRDDLRLVKAMGRETANVHLGTPDAAAAIRRDLKRRKRRWLFEAASRMAEATLVEWKAWRARRR
jgi:Uncharacterized protein conserved in bacteria (DUF2252)